MGTIREKTVFPETFPFVLEIKKQIPFRCNSIVMPVQKKVGARNEKKERKFLQKPKLLFERPNIY